MGFIGTPAAVEALSKQMRAPDPLHRAAAARALGRLRAGEKALRRGLKDRKAEVRILAVAALAGIDSLSARTAVLNYAEKPRDPDDSFDLRRIGRAAAAANRDVFTAARDARLAKARWDKVEKILEDLGVKHMAIRAQQIKEFGISPKQETRRCA